MQWHGPDYAAMRYGAGDALHCAFGIGSIARFLFNFFKSVKTADSPQIFCLP